MSRVGVGSLGLAVIAGALLALAFPGTGGQGWLAFGALVPLLVTIGETPWWRASVLGSVAGLSFRLTTTSWIAGTLVRYGDVSWFLAGLVVFALAVYPALYWAAHCGALAALRFGSGTGSVLDASSHRVAPEFRRAPREFP